MLTCLIWLKQVSKCKLIFDFFELGDYSSLLKLRFFAPNFFKLSTGIFVTVTLLVPRSTKPELFPCADLIYSGLFPAVFDPDVYFLFKKNVKWRESLNC